MTAPGTERRYERRECSKACGYPRSGYIIRPEIKEPDKERVGDHRVDKGSRINTGTLKL